MEVLKVVETSKEENVERDVKINCEKILQTLIFKDQWISGSQKENRIRGISVPWRSD